MRLSLVLVAVAGLAWGQATQEGLLASPKPRLTVGKKVALARSICPGKGLHCSSCPNGSNSVMGEDGNADLTTIIPGHFTNLSKDELLVWFLGCGTFRDPGFNVLFEKAGGVWRKVWLNADDSLDNCTIMKRFSQRDTLLCELAPHYRGYVHSSAVEIRLERTGPGEPLKLYEYVDQASWNCYSTNTKRRVKRTDLDRDGVPDFRVRLDVKQVPQSCNATSDSYTGTSILTFHSRDGWLQPTAETGQKVEKLKAVWQRALKDSM